MLNACAFFVFCTQNQDVKEGAGSWMSYYLALIHTGSRAVHAAEITAARVISSTARFRFSPAHMRLRCAPAPSMIYHSWLSHWLYMAVWRSHLDVTHWFANTHFWSSILNFRSARFQWWAMIGMWVPVHTWLLISSHAHSFMAVFSRN